MLNIAAAAGRVLVTWNMRHTGSVEPSHPRKLIIVGYNIHGDRMAELVTIPISFFELTIDYSRPHIWTDRAAVTQGMFDALQPWNIDVDDLEVRTTGKLSEQGVNFRLPIKRVSFFFGPAWCRFTRDDADWESADETISILEAFTCALTTFGRIELATKRTSVGLHIQPRTLSFMEILKPFVPPQLAVLDTAPVRTMAAVVKWDNNRRITIDGSGSVANGLFLKFDREFVSTATYEEMAHLLRVEEAELFAVLGLKEDRG